MFELHPRQYNGLPFQPSAILTTDRQFVQQLQHDIADTLLPASVVVPTHAHSPLSELAEPEPEPDPIYYTPNMEPVLYTNAAFEQNPIVPNLVDDAP